MRKSPLACLLLSIPVLPLAGQDRWTTPRFNEYLISAYEEQFDPSIPTSSAIDGTGLGNDSIDRVQLTLAGSGQYTWQSAKRGTFPLQEEGDWLVLDRPPQTGDDGLTYRETVRFLDLGRETILYLGLQVGYQENSTDATLVDAFGGALQDEFIPQTPFVWPGLYAVDAIEGVWQGTLKPPFNPDREDNAQSLAGQEPEGSLIIRRRESTTLELDCLGLTETAGEPQLSALFADWLQPPKTLRGEVKSQAVFSETDPDQSTLLDRIWQFRALANGRFFFFYTELQMQASRFDYEGGENSEYPTRPYTRLELYRYRFVSGVAELLDRHPRGLDADRDGYERLFEEALGLDPRVAEDRSAASGRYGWPAWKKRLGWMVYTYTVPKNPCTITTVVPQWSADGGANWATLTHLPLLGRTLTRIHNDNDSETWEAAFSIALVPESGRLFRLSASLAK